MTGFEADRLNHAPLSPEEERVLATAAPAVGLAGNVPAAI
jgi:hypothetical protein